MKRVVVIGSIAVGLFLVSALSVYGIMMLVKPKVSNFDAVSSTPMQVVEHYASESTDFWSDFTVNDSKSVYLGYLDQQNNRIFEYPAKYYTTYQKQNTTYSFDEVKKQSKKTFAKLGFTKSVESTDFISFDNDTKRCQVRVVFEPVGSYGVSCAAKDDIKSDTALAPRLLELYQNSLGSSVEAVKDSRVSFTLVQSKDPTIQYATMSFSGAETSNKGLPRPLFGAVDGNWEYVANLFNSDVPSDGQRSVSEADLAAMNSPKWKGYLSDVF